MCAVVEVPVLENAMATSKLPSPGVELNVAVGSTPSANLYCSLVTSPAAPCAIRVDTKRPAIEAPITETTKTATKNRLVLLERVAKLLFIFSAAPYSLIDISQKFLCDKTNSTTILAL
jgi:hypothetical protein